MERAPINADGTLGAFALVPDAALVLPRAGHASVKLGTWLYVVGGSGANGTLSSVERAKINVDGSLGQFAMVPDVALTIARSGYTIAVIGNLLYVFGGASESGADPEMHGCHAAFLTAASCERVGTGAAASGNGGC